MTQELTVQNPGFTEIATMSKVFYESGMFPDIRSAAQAIVKIQAGSELGFTPVYSLQKIYIVKGRVMVAAETMGAMVKKSGRYDYRVVRLTDTECELMFTDNGKDVYLSRFTMEDARRADLVSPGSGWQKWPRAMLMSKALSQGARIVCPHVISGTYTPEDFGGAVNPETEQLEGIVEDAPAKPGSGEIIQPVEKAQVAPVSTEPPPVQDNPAPAITAKPAGRDPETVKTAAQLVNAACADFKKTAKEVYRELGISSINDLTVKPADAYRQLAAVWGVK